MLDLKRLYPDEQALVCDLLSKSKHEWEFTPWQSLLLFHGFDYPAIQRHDNRSARAQYAWGRMGHSGLSLPALRALSKKKNPETYGRNFCSDTGLVIHWLYFPYRSRPHHIGETGKTYLKFLQDKVKNIKSPEEWIADQQERPRVDGFTPGGLCYLSTNFYEDEDREFDTWVIRHTRQRYAVDLHYVEDSKCLNCLYEGIEDEDEMDYSYEDECTYCYGDHVEYYSTGIDDKDEEFLQNWAKGNPSEVCAVLDLYGVDYEKL